jgi:hypothetical protein
MVGQILIIYEDAKISETYSASIDRAEIILTLQSVHIRHCRVAPVTSTLKTNTAYSKTRKQP